MLTQFASSKKDFSTFHLEHAQNFPWLLIVIFYLLSWLVVYYNMTLAVQVVLAMVFFWYAFSTFQNASILLLLSLFMPFLKDLVQVDIGGLNLYRVLFIPFLWFALNMPKRRMLQVSNQTFILIIISIFSIFLTAEIRKVVQEVPLSAGQDEYPDIKNTLSKSYDLIIYFSFIYFIFTRLKVNQISILINIWLLLGLLEAATLLFLVSQNPGAVIGIEFDKLYLWRNPYFGHKNDWGMILVFIVLAAYIKYTVSMRYRSFFIIVIIISLLAIMFSLSRQAYFCVVLGFFIIAVLQRRKKMVIYFSIAMILLLVFQPEFLINRMNSMLNVDSLDDFQGLSRKVGDLAINQAYSNLTLVPRMFTSNWEYNWSEGFWNGLLHQQGIIGLLFHFYFYMYFGYRFYYFYVSNNIRLSYFGLLGFIFTILIFISNVNRRSTHLMHYDGKIEQIGFFYLFIIIYTELIYYSLKNGLKSNDLIQ